MNGIVALPSAIVEVRATAPGYGDSQWVLASDPQCGDGEVNNGEVTARIEMMTAVWDDFHWIGPDDSVEHTLTEGNTIGLGWVIHDKDNALEDNGGASDGGATRRSYRQVLSVPRELTAAVTEMTMLLRAGREALAQQ